MARQHHYRRRVSQAAELDMTTFLNLMVVLVPFLLITAVFSRITIVELDLPRSAGGDESTEPGFRVEVIVRESGLEVSDGRQVIAAIPKRDGRHDLETLSQRVVSLKQEHPDSNAASVLLEPQIEYDHLIQVMDAVRSTVVRGEGEPAAGGQAKRLVLFPDISIGDAP
ncbi:MAG: ExbD/TolR family protein [bacterium]